MLNEISILKEKSNMSSIGLGLGGADASFNLSNTMISNLQWKLQRNEKYYKWLNWILINYVLVHDLNSFYY
jgi:hypothetical protein